MTTPEQTPESTPQAPSVGIVSSDWLALLNFMQLNQEELFEALGLLIDKIEACGASPALTDAVILASDISASVGNRWNRSQPERAQMVRSKLKPQPDVAAARKALKPVIDYVQTIKHRVPIGVVASALQVREALDGANTKFRDARAENPAAPSGE